MPKSILIGALVIVLEFIVGALIVPARLITWCNEKETAWLVDFYGARLTSEMRNQANAWFQRLFVDSGIMNYSYLFVVPTKEELLYQANIVNTVSRTGLPGFAKGRLDVFWIEIQQIIERLLHIAVWFITIAPLWFWHAWDGWQARNVKKHTFAYQSPFLHTYSLMASGAIWTGLIIAVMLPLPIHPAIYPGCTILQGILVGLIAANLPKRI